MEYFKRKERETNLMFGAYSDPEMHSKRDLDLAALAHMNRVHSNSDLGRESSASFQGSEVELAHRKRDEDETEQISKANEDRGDLN